MKTQEKHPSRAAMLKAVESGSVPFASHLEKCAACRVQFELMQSFAHPGGESLTTSGADAVSRLAVIPHLERRRLPERRLSGSLAQDSWAQLPAVALRDAAIGLERRIRLVAGSIALELVAERQADGWEFVARVYRNEETSSEFVLKAGARKLLSKSEGFYHWSSNRPPRTFELISPSVHVNFDKVSWVTAATK